MMQISIIIATFNSEETIEHCLDSVINQDFDSSKFEILVKDGSSSDSTNTIIEKFRDRLAYYEVSSDTGVYDAWNTCIAHSRGEWLLFLGSDDFFLTNNCLSLISPILVESKINGKYIVHGKNVLTYNNKFIEENGNEIKQPLIDFSRGMIINHPGCFHFSEVVKQQGLYDTEYKIMGDYELIYRILLSYGEGIFQYYNFPIVVHSFGGISTNPSKSKSLIHESYEFRKKYHLVPSKTFHQFVREIIYMFHLSWLLKINYLLKLNIKAFINRNHSKAY